MGARKTVGYARMRIGDKAFNDMQDQALRAASCGDIVYEYADDATAHQPAFADLLTEVGPGDVVVVWRMSRLATSMRRAVAMAWQIVATGADLLSVAEGLDTGTREGSVALRIVEDLAEAERGTRSEKTTAGLAKAGAEGRIGGRPAKLDQTTRRLIARAAGANEATRAELARRHGISEATVSRIVSAHAEGP